jgi:hypothetical protein
MRYDKAVGLTKEVLPPRPAPSNPFTLAMREAARQRAMHARSIFTLAIAIALLGNLLGMFL